MEDITNNWNSFTVTCYNKLNKELKELQIRINNLLNIDKNYFIPKKIILKQKYKSFKQLPKIRNKLPYKCRQIDFIE